MSYIIFFFFSSRRRHTRLQGDWSSDVCSSDLRTRYVPGGWDLLAFVLVFCLFVYMAQAAHGLIGSLEHLEATPISLEPSALVGYAARTALRMLIAMLASLVFTF